ncbi:sugar phosphate isomerase/epimerase family protein [Bacillus sp. 31A1R]|uniref:Sugar phosphate isomerase/epimerase family protein n=1 Tax=Robertmurraya mangrovi TaxID=3098077 RepID=A0ABU5J1R3_9BACI|nr:sugar phosphate isomerase/epimerase family protein [Bacillus sp. 31A1R]MDZ5473287.1 sugar phosphate isomerase/epimerase family protein [Bacillus sp. 31A1R]
MRANQNIGMSTFAVMDLPLVQGMDALMNEGFTNIEIMCEGNGLECLDWSLEQMLAIASWSDISITIHAPIKNCNPASDDPTIRETSLTLLKKCLHLAEMWNSPYVLMHLGEHEDQEKGLKNCIHFIEEISQYIPLGTKLVLENVPPKNNLIGVTAKELVQVCSHFQSEKVGVVFDVGHANLVHLEYPVEGLKEVLPWLVGLHVSDNFGQDDNHNLVGEGTVPIVELLKMIEDCKQEVSIILEMRNVEDGVRSREVLFSGLGV